MPNHNHGVRQYSDYVGRFLCPDGLWAKYVGWTPYQYAENNPINSSDGNGFEDLKEGWIIEPNSQTNFCDLSELTRDIQQFNYEHPVICGGIELLGGAAAVATGIGGILTAGSAIGGLVATGTTIIGVSDVITGGNKISDGLSGNLQEASKEQNIVQDVGNLIGGNPYIDLLYNAATGIGTLKNGNIGVLSKTAQVGSSATSVITDGSQILLQNSGTNNKKTVKGNPAPSSIKLDTYGK